MEAIKAEPFAFDPKERIQEAIKRLVATAPVETPGDKIRRGAKLAEISGIASDMEHERLDMIYRFLQEAPPNLVVDDMRFMYLMLQRAFEHERELRQKLDDLIQFIMKLQIERATFRG